MLRDLTIQNYRCFEDFYIDGLERVNLFVGKNNSGKTSLLEAIYLLVNFDRKTALIETIKNHLNYLNFTEYYFDLYNLFFKHNPNNYIYINSAQKDKGICILLKGNSNLFCSEVDNSHSVDKVESYSLKWDSPYQYKEFKLPVKNIKYLEINTEQSNLDSNFFLVNERFNKENNLFISTDRIDYHKISLMWDKINLTNKEAKIIEALKIIDPNVVQIGFLININSEPIKVRKNNNSYPIPLSSMGDGMYRIFNLAMSLVTAENGVLLIDEIETGLHYEAQTDMWRLILETAKELNVQVFATTHSWDCIAAFNEALSQVEDKSIGKLFRLDDKYGKLRAVEYDAEDLEVATSEGIEVR